MRFCDRICGGGTDSSSSPPRMPLRGAHEPATRDTQKRSAIHQVFLIFGGRIDFMVRSTLTSGATCSFRRPLPPILRESNPYWLSAQGDEVFAVRGFRTLRAERSTLPWEICLHTRLDRQTILGSRVLFLYLGAAQDAR